MNKFNYSSIFAPYINKFISMKNACGYDVLRTKWILYEFDRFFVAEGVKELYIKKVQIEKIFQSCDGLLLYDRHMHVNMMVLPALIRLLYSTGLRISEALSIRNADVDFNSGVISIKKTKNGEQRLAPLTESMVEVLKEYIFERNKIPVTGVNRPNSFLFVSLTGKPCTSGSIYNWFRKILERCNIPHTGNHHGPRVHDLRHTCAVHALIKMCEDGLDLYCALPLLSAFIGHKSLSATEQYLRLTAEMYPYLINQQQELCSYVFPDNNSQ
jgi:integrase